MLTLLALACVQDPRLPLDRPLPDPPTERARAAVERAVGWLDTALDDPAVPVNLDAVIAFWNVARTFRSPALDARLVKLRETQDRPGEPRRRFYTPEARLAENPSTRWTPAPDTHPNRILVEVLYCPEWGLRPESVAWICSTLRDGGGRSSAHGAWFLSMAVDGGCVARDQTCLDDLAEELVAGAAIDRPLDTPVEADLLGEQVLFGLLAGVSPERLGSAVDRLIAVQQADGGFGTPDQVSAHAALVASWGLTEWIRRQQPSMSAVAPNAPAVPGPPPGVPPVPIAKPTPGTEAPDPSRQITPIDGPPLPPAP